MNAKRLFVAVLLLALAGCAHAQNSVIPRTPSSRVAETLQSASAASASACAIVAGTTGIFAGASDAGGVSASDAWNIQRSPIQFGTPMQFSHFNGTKWSPVPAPTIPNESSYNRIDLFGLVPVASNDVWTSGVGFFGAMLSTPFFLHWDGSAWRYIPSPQSAPQYVIVAIAGNAPNDVWALGQPSLMAMSGTLDLLHWDGVKWQIVFTEPSVRFSYTGSGSQLAVFSPNDVWMMLPRTQNNVSVDDIIAHWDGKTITRTARLPLSGQVGGFGFFGGTSDNDLWYDATLRESFAPYIARKASTWATYSTSLADQFPFNIIDFRPGYALIAQGFVSPGLLVYNGYVRWRPTRSPFPKGSSVVTTSIVKGTTSFWTSYTFDSGSSAGAALVRCPSSPPAPL